jgi:hypothetical protein
VWSVFVFIYFSRETELIRLCVHRKVGERSGRGRGEEEGVGQREREINLF